MDANPLPRWLATLTTAGETTRAADRDAMIAYEATDRVFRAPGAPHRPGQFTEIDQANRFASRVARIEGLGDVYVMPCHELTIQAVALDVSGRVVVCIPAEPNALWSRVTVLHELAHVLAGPEAGHGPIWAGIFVRLVRSHLSRPAGDRLDWEFHLAGLGAQVSADNLAVVAAVG